MLETDYWKLEMPKAWIAALEGDDDAGNDDTGDQDTPPTKTFTQTDVDRIVQTEKAKQKKSYEGQIKQLQSLRDSSNLSKKQVSELNDQIESLKSEYMTKEELAREESQKAARKHAQEIKDAQAETESWKTRYTQSTIARSLVDAAVAEDAYNPEQIVAILTPDTKLIDELDDAGNQTGNLVPKVTMIVAGDDDKPTTIEIAPADAVKRLKESEKYLNLFVSKTKGGLNLHNLDVDDKNKGPIKDTNEYMKQRNKAKGRN